MRDYKITFKLDSIVNFDEPFAMNDLSFYYMNSVLYAQTTITARDAMEAQGLALTKVTKTCSVLSHIFQCVVNYYIDKVEELNEDGNVIASMSSVEGTLYVRKKISESDIRNVLIITKLMEHSKELENVMLLVNRPDFKSWGTLYKIYEIIDHSAGIKKQGWITDKNRNLFKRTSNHPAVSGADARHGFQREQPPENPMTNTEAVILINNLIDQWIEYLCKKDNA